MPYGLFFFIGFTTYAPFPPGAPPAPVKTGRQWGGYLLAMLIYLVFVFLFAFSARMAIDVNVKGDFQTFFILSAVSFLPIVVFFLLIAKDNSEYLVGKPSMLKLLPVIIGSLLLIATSIFGLQNADQIFVGDLYPILCKVSLVLAPIFPVLFYFMYFGDDASGSWTLVLKPWAFPAGAPVFGQPPTFIHPSQQQIPRV